MTGRERVLSVLNRRTPDTVPLDIGGTDCSSVHVLPYQRLRATLRLPEKPILCGCLTQLIAELDADAKDALGVDVEPLFYAPRETKIWNTPFGVPLVVPKKFNVQDLPDGSSDVRDAEGCVVSRRAAGAYYFDPVGTPLAHLTVADELAGYDAMFERWDYSAVYDEPLADLAARARAKYRATDRAVVAQWQLHYMQAGMFMRGYEQFLVDLMVDKPLAHAMLDKLHAAYLKRMDAFFGAFGDTFDIVFLCDDLGTQLSGLISPELYREMLYPCFAEVIAKIKAHGKKVIMHSCGAVAEFVPFFIEMGVDALNPVQVSANGMNPRDLVRQFGKDIAFWGGGCNTQGALNARDTDTVRRDVRQRLDEFGPDAHLVFTQVHNIQYDVLPENILAMVDELRKQTQSA